MNKIVEIKNLKTYFFTDEGTVKAVDGVSFHVERGKTLGVVGESGCGKSVTARSVLRIVGSRGKIVDGEILFHRDGGEIVDLTRLDPTGPEIRAIRGKEIAMIFQEPMTALSPVYTIGNQIIEAIVLHQDVDKQEAREIAIEMLRKVGIPNPERRIDEYPHQLSGGMRQRAMIAMSLSCHPKLLIADEPTTALDVTIQAQILDLMRDLQKEFGAAIMMITHNMGVIAEMADDVVVMYLGKVVESVSVDGLFYNPAHPYTKALLRSIPRVGKKVGKRLESIKEVVPDAYNIPPGCTFHPRCPEFMKGLCDVYVPKMVEVSPGHKVSCFLYNGGKEMPKGDILEVKNLKKYFPIREGFRRKITGYVKAVDDVSFTVREGETLGLVGESGSGKTTIGMCILRAIEPTSGEILFKHEDGENVNLEILEHDELRDLRKDMQMIFQDPYSSLNPRMTVREIIGEPLLVNGVARGRELSDMVADLMTRVGLRHEYMGRYPHAFSGGQRQRIGIARALALNPRLVVCDEPVSSLDVSIQAQILNLLQDLQEELQLTYIFIAHDLGVVEHISERVAVMYVGKIVELADTEELFANPRHPYTEALLSAVPKLDPRASSSRLILKGEVADASNPPMGCYFHPRCNYARDICSKEIPVLGDIYSQDDTKEHYVACHFAQELELKGTDALA